VARSEDLSTQKAGLLARFAFTDGLFTLQTTQSGKKQWNVTLLFPKSLNLAPLHNLALAAAKEEWGDKAEAMIRDGIIKSPFLDGDGKQGKSKKTGEPHKGFPGHTFIRCTSGEDYRPKLVDNKLAPITEKSELGSGDYGYATVNAFTWENKENGKGITFGISWAMRAKRGESLGGGGSTDPHDNFEAVPDEGDAPAETKTGSGAAGLFG
jgi:hypothetical protein